MAIRFGNAPCSWGTIEGWGQGIGYSQMLDELKASGYHGTELGDWGYMPTEPARLRQELQTRGLSMLGAYEGVYLLEPGEHAAGEARVLRTARLLQSVADLNDNWSPLVVLADEHSRDPVRFQHAGRIRPEQSLSAQQWKVFAAGASRIARAVHDETGLRTVFHHHCAGYVETPWEIEALLEHTDERVLGLVFDTGHYLYGTGLNEPEGVLEGLERFKDRLWYVHYKDCHPQIASRARREGWNYKEAIGQGVFCELGQGQIDFGAVTRKLQALGYDGWITVEQDVLPGMGQPKESAQRNRDYLRRVTGL
ncbi:TIM barrel protein [Meiothermus taiwanensis]|jgi:inosose dehydratase|uniref:Inosose dehydratase n=2 Tax=Meiothermus taiwanensis TaxID=172827 RepID=A0A399DSQ6_9DEIN|nr:TIM barrel protein [Meiothermus taiwanensis]AWR86504.1 inosose dehydratase [Meiothermus taiwanensis WR-220]KIQ54999.1 xylose isomerase [Meiothermus taiwanensis]KZK16578.1 xylose isomerase [Meiothermus taiwanensis]RIH75106.1 Inosose dehydratase [Meiothermus taiwanensis]